VRLSNPQKFTEIYTVLGVNGQGAYGAGNTPGPSSAIGTAFGLAVANTPGAPLYVATGTDPRVVKVAP
jgi:hypothetical protein